MATVRSLVRIAVRAAEDKKAQDVRAIDVRGISSVTDYMVIATGTSDTNVRAIAEGVREKLAAKGDRPLSLEGMQEGSWVLLDYVDFVVHVFHAEKRLYFGLEELWADAKALPIPTAPSRKAAARTVRPAAAEPAAAAAPPAVPRKALKPAAKKSATPRAKSGAKKPAPKKTAVPKRTAGS